MRSFLFGTQFTVFCLLLSAVATPSYADKASPKQFYGEKYAKPKKGESADVRASFGGSKAANLPTAKNMLSESSKPIVGDAKPVEKAEIEGEAAPSSGGAKEGLVAGKAVKEISGTFDKPGIKIEAIGIIVNADDVPHFAAHLKTLTRTALKLDIPIQKTLVMGDFLKFMRSKESRDMVGDSLFWVPMLGSQLKPTRRFPKEYNVKLSPTWILSTKKGEVLLEGVTNLKKYINSKGEYMDLTEFAEEDMVIVKNGLTKEALKNAKKSRSKKKPDDCKACAIKRAALERAKSMQRPKHVPALRLQQQAKESGDRGEATDEPHAATAF